VTWLDFLTVALIIIFVVIEVKRKAICATIDVVGGFLAVKVAKLTYQNIASPTVSESVAYLTIFFVAMAAVFVVSTLAQHQLQSDIGPFDSTVSVIFGALVGLYFAHIAFGVTLIQYGADYKPLTESVLRSQVYDLAAVKGFVRFMQGLGEPGSIK